MDIRCSAGALLLGFVTLPYASGIAHAANGSVQASELDPIQVTATRTPQPQSTSLAPNTVITREDIERTQAQSVRELLRRSPGISFANNGGPGKATSVFMRGADSDQVLVLVDGVRYGSATLGQAAFQDLPVSQIERIEIVRGPRSSIYGSDAIGGVIQIFTRDGGGETRPYASIGAGSYGTRKGRVGVSGGNGQANYNISLGTMESDGFDSCGSAAAGAGGCFVDQPDDDGYERTTGSMRVGYRFENGLKFKAHALRAEGENEFDGSKFAGDESDTLQQLYGVSVGGRPVDPWFMELSVNRSRDESELFFNDQFVDTFDTVRDSVRLQNDVSLGSGDSLTFGLDYRRAEVESTQDYARTRRDNAGAFLQYLGTWGDHHLRLAGRGDDNEQFGEHATGSATYGWDFSSVHTITVSYGTAFKAPTFNELYYPGYGNPDLAPEESRSFEVGLTSNREWGRWSLHAYETRIEELISTVETAPYTYTALNINEARIRGVEASADVRLAEWQFHTDLTWLDPENRADGANKGNDLPRRPEYSAQLDVDRFVGRFNLGLSVHVAGKRFDDSANKRELDAYQLVTLRGGVRLGDDWKLQARLENLLDEDYQTAEFYNQPDRNVFVTLRYQPE